METTPPSTDAQPITAKPRRRWFQFSLRTLLILVTLAAIPMSWLAVRIHRAKQQRKAVEVFEKYKCYIFCDRDFQDHPVVYEPAWLRKILGDDFFVNIVVIDFQNESPQDPPMNKKDMESLKYLTQLEGLILKNINISQAGLKPLEGLNRLVNLDLTNTRVTDAELDVLKGMKQLECLTLDDNQIVDLKYVNNLGRLQRLSLANTKINDASLEHIKGLKQLFRLDLSNTQITDEGLKHLIDLYFLQDLDIFPILSYPRQEL